MQHKKLLNLKKSLNYLLLADTCCAKNVADKGLPEWSNTDCLVQFHQVRDDCKILSYSVEKQPEMRTNMISHWSWSLTFWIHTFYLYFLFSLSYLHTIVCNFAVVSVWILRLLPKTCSVFLTLDHQSLFSSSFC